MKTFVIKETAAVWVEFTRTVQAKSEKKALEAFYLGNSVEFQPPTILDSIDGYDSEIECEATGE